MISKLHLARTAWQKQRRTMAKGVFNGHPSLLSENLLALWAPSRSGKAWIQVLEGQAGESILVGNCKVREGFCF